VCFVGAGVFAGYRGRDDLTKMVLCKIENEMCYRTGDLGRLNPITRTFEYCGRQDFQVKLRGQRIELGEIESVIMEKASACIVTKTTYDNSDYLVAYVESKISEFDLRQHCLSRLPLYMVPSFFIILEKLPLNQNGKLDRKALPSVDFSSLSVSPIEGAQQTTEMERKVFSLWCQVLPHLTSMPSVSTSFFSLGGNSLSLIRLCRKYQTSFKYCVKKLTVIDLFRNLSIRDHALLILQHSKTGNGPIDTEWNCLNIIEGKMIFHRRSICTQPIAHDKKEKM
jgi:hypothetical protein